MKFLFSGSLLERARVITAIVAVVGMLLSLGWATSGYADTTDDDGALFQITLDPADVTAHPGDTAQFTAAATGDPAPLVQWQHLVGDAWVDIDGATSTTLLLSDVQTGDSGRQFRAVFTQADQVLTSGSASLTVVPLQTVPAAPAAPTVGSPTYHGATITWQPPTSDGGAAITAYTLRVYKAGESTPARVVDLGAVLQSTIDGLEQGTNYEATVSAANSVGAGAASGRTAFTTAAFTAPGEPTGLRVESVGQRNASIAWVAPAQNGGSTVTDYEVTVTRSGAPVSTATVEVSGTTASISGLAPGTAYVVHVAASNSVGTGAAATQAVTTNPEASGPVQGLTVTSVTTDSLAISWQAPASDGGSPITSYQVTATDSGTPVSSDNISVSGTTASITGLAPGTVYEVQVAAVNAVGTGAESTVSAETGKTVPGAVRSVTLTSATTNSVSISWEAPASDGGSTITSYQVTATRAGTPVSSDNISVSGTTASITGLAPGTAYEVRVVAVNEVGTGAAGTLEAETEPQAPGVVRDLEVTSIATDSLSVSWQAPASDGGSTITSYEVSVTLAGAPASSADVDVSGTTATITGLEPGKAYVVQVAAINSVGAGAESTVSAETKKTVPGAVRGIALTEATTGGVSISWQAPASDGGSPITSYQVTITRSGVLVSSADVDKEGTTATITGLQAGTEYAVHVVAHNALGIGPTTTLTVETQAPGAPGVVRNLETTSVTTDSVSVSWQAPASNGGRPITGYGVIVTHGGAAVPSAIVSVSGTIASITGLEPETTYEVTVRAENVIGAGPPVTLSVDTPPVVEVPGVVTGLTVTSVTTNRVSISWQAPASDGGSPILHYQVVLEAGGQGVPGASAVMTGATSARISGLEPETSYTIRVAATNAIGTGPVSAQVVGTTAAVERPADGRWVYTTPGTHDVNGRWWHTTCEPYSQTTRCTTLIWATVVKYEAGRFNRKDDWTFNNLTYLPQMTRAEWAHNPLGFTGSWTADDDRRWRTECDTPNTGRGGCRSYLMATVVESTSSGYRVVTKEVFNNIVLFDES